MTQQHKELKSPKITKDILLTINGVDSNQLEKLEIQPEALELMTKQNNAEQFVLKTNESEVEDESVKFDDLEIIQDDQEGIFCYSLITFSFL